MPNKLTLQPVFSVELKSYTVPVVAAVASAVMVMLHAALAGA